MIWLFCIIISIIAMVITSKFQYRFIFLDCITRIIGIIVIIFAFLTSLLWVSNILQYDSKVIKYEQTRIALVNELEEYDDIRLKHENSDTYIELQEKVINFNYKISLANNINSFLLDNVFIDPAYREIEPIPILAK